MTETPSEFQAALHFFCKSQDRKEPSDIRKWINYYWQQHQTVLDYGRDRQGQLEEADFSDLKDARHILTVNPNNGRHILRLFFGDQMNVDQIDLFLDVLRGLLAGVAAAHHLSGWPQNDTSNSLSPDAKQALEECFRQYHVVWDLWSLPVTSIAGTATSRNHSDRATAILDAFHQAMIKQAPEVADQPTSARSPEWWTQSNWLLVRRLLSYLLGDQDSEMLGDDNQLQMLLVTEDGHRGYRGLTAPVTTSLRSEGWNSAYLDPVALGMFRFDEDMLNSLRIAARICRPDLKKETSLRIALSILPTELLSVAGQSAGGIVTVAACATAQKRRLDRDRTASFTVSVKDIEALRKDVERDLSIDDVRFGVVDHQSIRAKLTSDDFRNAALKAVYLCHEQKCGSLEWSEWVPLLEQQEVIRIYPVGKEERDG